VNHATRAVRRLTLAAALLLAGSACTSATGQPGPPNTVDIVAPCDDPLVKIPATAEWFRPGGPTFTVLADSPADVNVDCSEASVHHTPGRQNDNRGT
jgi:hypothetical protein